MATSVIQYKNNFVAKRYLTANDDVNDFIGASYTGMYYCSTGQSCPANIPTDSTGSPYERGLLIVSCSNDVSSSVLTQQYYIRLLGGTRDRIFMRVYSGSPASWHDWLQIAKERNGLTQSFRTTGTFSTWRQYTQNANGQVVIMAGSPSLIKSLTNVNIGGFVISRYSISSQTGNRIDYIVLIGINEGIISGYVLDSETTPHYHFEGGHVPQGTASYSNLRAVGHITSGGTECTISVPFFPKGTVITVSKILSSIRTHDGTYLGGASGTDLTSYIDSVSFNSYQNLLRIRLIKSNGWGVTNNTPVCGQVNLTYTISN